MSTTQRVIALLEKHTWDNPLTCMEIWRMLDAPINTDSLASILRKLAQKGKIQRRSNIGPLGGHGYAGAMADSSRPSARVYAQKLCGRCDLPRSQHLGANHYCPGADDRRCPVFTYRKKDRT